nr:ImmA/IrrE family metallo-endopeptidase [uncultured Cellulosilyticum sp.]
MGNRCNYRRPNFDKCEDKATELLSEQTIKNSLITVEDLNFDKFGGNIVFESMQSYSKITGYDFMEFVKVGYIQDGFTIHKDGVFIILYNDELPEERINWTMAHEVGHILLGHTNNKNCLNKINCKNEYGCDVEEVEANWFAAQLLMPKYVIYRINQKKKLRWQDLYYMFNVSREAAKNRFKYIENMTIQYDERNKVIWRNMYPSVVGYYMNYNAYNKNIREDENM